MGPAAFWLAVVAGALASFAALYGRYRVLPSFLTGPTVCRLEAGGCHVLFRTPDAALLGVPNSALGLLFHLTLAVGRLAAWPSGLLLCGATVALAMSVRLIFVLVSQGLECRVCWLGHFANITVWLVLAFERI